MGIGDALGRRLRVGLVGTGRRSRSFAWLASIATALLLTGCLPAVRPTSRAATPDPTATPVAGTDEPNRPVRTQRRGRPNIVFITTDDMRVDDLRAMPSVRRLLAERGTTFVNSYAPFPLCCPARAAWLTGQYNHNNGVMGNGLGNWPENGFAALDGGSTVATWLRRAGYQTAFVGKYLNGYGDTRPIGVPSGWVEWHGEISYGHYFDTELLEANAGKVATHRYVGRYQVYLYDSIARDVLTRRLPRTAPLFLWVSQFAPHFGAPAESDDGDMLTPAVPHRWRDHFSGARLPRDSSFNEPDVSDKPRYVSSRPRLSRGVLAKLAELNSQRWESLRAVDESIARIVRTLRASGELANTVIVFSSDNGYMLGEHRLPPGKGVPYEHASRVPLIVRGPGFPAGTTRRPWVANIDLAPTFAELAEAKPGLVVDGRSLLPLAADPSSWEPRSMAMEVGPSSLGGPDTLHGVLTRRYKYIRYATGEEELYDLRLDPDEETNLVTDPAHEPLRTRLARLTDRMQNCTGLSCQ